MEVDFDVLSKDADCCIVNEDAPKQPQLSIVVPGLLNSCTLQLCPSVSTLSHQEFIPDLACSGWHCLLNVRESVARKGGRGEGLQRWSRQDRARQPCQGTYGQHGHEWGCAQGAREVPVSSPVSCLTGFCLHLRSGATRQTLWHREHHDKDDTWN